MVSFRSGKVFQTTSCISMALGRGKSKCHFGFCEVAALGGRNRRCTVVRPNTVVVSNQTENSETKSNITSSVSNATEDMSRLLTQPMIRTKNQPDTSTKSINTQDQKHEQITAQVQKKPLKRLEKIEEACCPICQEGFTCPENQTELGPVSEADCCRQLFHLKCKVQQMVQDKRCSLCREPWQPQNNIEMELYEEEHKRIEKEKELAQEKVQVELQNIIGNLIKRSQKALKSERQFHIQCLVLDKAHRTVMLHHRLYMQLPSIYTWKDKIIHEKIQVLGQEIEVLEQQYGSANQEYSKMTKAIELPSNRFTPDEAQGAVDKLIELYSENKVQMGYIRQAAEGVNKISQKYVKDSKKNIDLYKSEKQEVDRELESLARTLAEVKQANEAEAQKRRQCKF